MLNDEKNLIDDATMGTVYEEFEKDYNKMSRDSLHEVERNEHKTEAAGRSRTHDCIFMIISAILLLVLFIWASFFADRRGWLIIMTILVIVYYGFSIYVMRYEKSVYSSGIRGEIEILLFHRLDKYFDENEDMRFSDGNKKLEALISYMSDRKERVTRRRDCIVDIISATVTTVLAMISAYVNIGKMYINISNASWIGPYIVAVIAGPSIFAAIMKTVPVWNWNDHDESILMNLKKLRNNRK